jgi:hypothetical protein
LILGNAGFFRVVPGIVQVFEPHPPYCGHLGL